MTAREGEERLTAVEDLQRELNTLQLELLREEKQVKEIGCSGLALDADPEY